METYSEDDVFGGGRPRAVSFKAIGDKIKGVVERSEAEPIRDMQTGAVQKWDNGNGKPKLQLILTLRTDQRDPSNPDDDGRRTLYVKSFMLVALNDAITRSGWKRPSFDVPSGKLTGCTVAVRYSGNGTPKQRGYTAPKQWEVYFKPPAADFKYDLGGSADDGAFDDGPDAPGAGQVGPPPQRQSQGQRSTGQQSRGGGWAGDGGNPNDDDIPF